MTLLKGNCRGKDNLIAVSPPVAVVATSVEQPDNLCEPAAHTVHRVYGRSAKRNGDVWGELGAHRLASSTQ
jgi:hypothetical protein